jgi:hypothetical protein
VSRSNDALAANDKPTACAALLSFHLPLRKIFQKMGEKKGETNYRHGVIRLGLYSKDLNHRLQEFLA